MNTQDSTSRESFSGAGSADDDPASILHRQATVLKEAGDWAGAIALLEQAKPLMIQSPWIYPYQMWCRLAKFLQYGGRYEDSMREFDALKADLARRGRAEYKVDNPNIHYGESKIRLARRFVRVHCILIERERRIVQAREARWIKQREAKEARLAKKRKE